MKDEDPVVETPSRLSRCSSMGLLGMSAGIWMVLRVHVVVSLSLSEGNPFSDPVVPLAGYASNL